jgi:hypothetical protein
MSSATTLRDSAKEMEEDDDATPHGSVENIPNMPNDNECQYRRNSMEAMAAARDTLGRLPVRAGPPVSSSILTRSTSMSTSGNPPSAASVTAVSAFGPRDQFARRSLTMSSSVAAAKGVSFAPTATVMNGNGNEGLYKKVSTHHVIPVNAAAPTSATAAGGGRNCPQDKLSPEGEIYGFGVKFKENTRHYFTSHHHHQHQSPPDAADAGGYHSGGGGGGGHPMSQEAVQNQIFLNQLSAKLTGTVMPSPSSSSLSSAASTTTLTPTPPPPASAGSTQTKSRLNAEIESATLKLKRTTSISDRSAPKLQ